MNVEEIKQDKVDFSSLPQEIFYDVDLRNSFLQNLDLKSQDKVKCKILERYEQYGKDFKEYIKNHEIKDGCLYFDSKEFCEKHNISKKEFEYRLEITKKAYNKVEGIEEAEDDDITFLFEEIYSNLKDNSTKIKIISPKGKINYDEEKLFNRLCKNGCLDFKDIRNLHSIDYKIYDGDFLVKVKTIATYTKPRIENILNFNGNEFENKKLLKIKDEIIDLKDGINYFDNFIEAIKPKGNIGCISNYLEQYSDIYDYFVKRYDDESEIIKKTDSYGFYGGGKDMYRNWELNLSTDRARDFKKLINTEYELKEVETLLIKLKEYLGNDDFTKIIFEWGLASIFRYDLMNSKRLHKFPYLLVIGKQRIGKTARINTIFNKMLLNTNYAYGSDDLKGSISKIAKEQYVNLPMWFDELVVFPDKLIDWLKAMATVKDTVIIRGNKNTNEEDYKFTLRRPFLISTNRFTLDDPALLERFIIISASDYELEDHSDIGNEIQDHIYKVGAFIYDNIEMIKKYIDTLDFEYAREKANENTIMIGREIAKIIYQFFDLEYIPSNEVKYGNGSIYSSKDTIKQKIIDEVIRKSEWIENGIKRNIFDYFVDPETYKQGAENITKYGMFPYSDRIGRNYIAITKTAIMHLKLKDEGIKKLTDFDAHELEYTVIREKVTGTPKRVVLIPVSDIEDDIAESPEEQKNIQRIINYLETEEKAHEVYLVTKMKEDFEVEEETTLEILKKLSGKVVRKIDQWHYMLINISKQMTLDK